MEDSKAKALILEIGRRMYLKNFVAANDGNISCKTKDNFIYTTPSGVSKGFMEEDTLVKMKLDGTVVSKGSLPPSSEIKMHLALYNANPEIMGITHAHPPFCTSFAVAGVPLDKMIYPEAFVNLGTVPCIPYATPGSDEVATSVIPYAKTHTALLLASHGAVSFGKSLMDAFYKLEAMEHYAMILLFTGSLIGKANTLTEMQIKELIKIREKLGNKNA